MSTKKPQPELANETPTMEIFIAVNEVLLLKTTVAEICNEVETNLQDMPPGDYQRIENLYRAMVYWRDQQVKELPIFQSLPPVQTVLEVLR